MTERMTTLTTFFEPDDRLAAIGNQLVQVHVWLREELELLREGIDAAIEGDGERPRDLRAHCRMFCWALTRHHTGEDEGAFPVVGEHFPALRPVLAELTRDHQLVTATSSTRSASSSQPSTPSCPDRGRETVTT